MKKILSLLLLGASTLLATTSCVEDFAEPNTDDLIITSPTSVGEVNTTIRQVKDRFCASSTGADISRNASNFAFKVNEDLIFEGVIVANDISGNLYQTVMIRNIDPATGEDQSIIISIKNTCLYPYFRLGQRLRINVNGLYVGVYSKVPRVGQPYYSSQGNLNLGPILLDKCRTNIELIGEPDLTAPELVPEDLTDNTGEAWLRASDNKAYSNVPRLATVSGLIDEVQGAKADKADRGELTGNFEPLPKIFGPDELHDAGFGVDRTILLKSNNSKVALRTSTQNNISFLPIPQDVRRYTGILTYYDNWQIQLRDLNDISAAAE